MCQHTPPQSTDQLQCRGPVDAQCGQHMPLSATRPRSRRQRVAHSPCGDRTQPRRHVCIRRFSMLRPPVLHGETHKTTSTVTTKSTSAQCFLTSALCSIGFGVLSVIPFNLVLRGDPGSPLFVSFALHVVIIATSLPNAGELFRNRKIPMSYHVLIALLGCCFTVFKSDALTRLPTGLCMLLANMKMVVGVAVQFALFGKACSRPQLLGVGLVTAGMVVACAAMQGLSLQSSNMETSTSSFVVGVAEMLGVSIALTLMSSVLKISSSRFGESAQEQVFFQHLLSLPLVFPSQWDKVGPRMFDWIARGDCWLMFNLAASVILTFAARRASSQMASRAPSLTAGQLVQTLESFIQMSVVTLFHTSPPLGFYFGALVLCVGTLQYIACSKPQ